jgi:hypothetical protein
MYACRGCMIEQTKHHARTPFPNADLRCTKARRVARAAATVCCFFVIVVIVCVCACVRVGEGGPPPGGGGGGGRGPPPPPPVSWLSPSARSIRLLEPAALLFCLPHVRVRERVRVLDPCDFTNPQSKRCLFFQVREPRCASSNYKARRTHLGPTAANGALCHDES